MGWKRMRGDEVREDGVERDRMKGDGVKGGEERDNKSPKELTVHIDFHFLDLHPFPPLLLPPSQHHVSTHHAFTPHHMEVPREGEPLKHPSAFVPLLPVCV